MAKYSYSPGNALNSSVDMDNSRRLFNFGERVAELAPQQSPFFTYLSKVAKKATDDPVFKFLEQRHQWQRRNFEVQAAHANNDLTSDATLTTLKLTCFYDAYGKITTSDTAPTFLLQNQMLAIDATDGSDDSAVTVFGRIEAAPVEASGYTSVTFEVYAVSKAGSVTHASSGAVAGYTDIDFADGDKGQVVGSAWAEASTDPEGWADKLYDREGYAQIFKTAIPLYSGTSLSTKYRGINNEYKRVWQEKLMEHKMDIEQAMLFGIGRSDETGTGPMRFTHGILPYTEANGKIYNFNYASSGYDAFLDAMEDYFAPESGNSADKLVLTSRKILGYLNKLGDAGFLNVGASQYRLDVASVPGKFGHMVTVVDTIFGKLHFVADPLLRGMWEDYAVAVDLKNVAYRPLAGNGVSRDTHILTNVQNNNVDGRKDMVLTEAGLEISLPETHAILKFS